MNTENSHQHHDDEMYHYRRRTRRKSRWWIPVAILGVLLIGFVGMVFVFFAVVGSSFEAEPIQVQSRTVLSINMSEPLEETTQTNPFAFLSSSPARDISFFDALAAIERAKNDPDIVGIYYQAGGLNTGFAKATELREKLLDFKKSGKFIWAFIETGSESDYYFASVADSIFMPSESWLEMDGFGIAGMFLKGALEKLGIDYHVVQFEDFKSAAEPLSREGYSDSAKVQIREILQQRYNYFVNAVAESRGLAASDVEKVLYRGVYTPDSLMKLGLIDGYYTKAQLEERMKDAVNAGYTGAESELDELRTISLKKYANSSNYTDSDAELNEDVEIAIVFGSGAIVSGKSQGSPFGGEEQVIASETFIENLFAARDNEDVDAILLRIDSPGGSAIASDAIWQAIQETRKVKPVYASMSDVAASGGYYIAMACEEIVAHPTTITGSVGVILAVPNFTGLIDNIGVTVDTMATGPAALFFNPFVEASERDKEKLYHLAEGIYKSFVSKAAESRGKSYEEMRALAKGRVWTGAAAHNKNLIDVPGGFHDAIQLVKDRMNVPEGQKVRVHMYPKPEDPFETFLKILDIEESGGQSTLAAAVGNDKGTFGAYATLFKSLPSAAQEQLHYLMQVYSIAHEEKVMMALPFLPVVD